MRSIALICSFLCVIRAGAQSPVIQDILDAVRIDSMLFYVQQMSGEVPVDLGSGPVSITSRHTDNAGNALAQQYYEQKFASLGYTTSAQAFNTTGRNILVTKPGLAHPEEIVVLCAHYDALPAGMFAAPAADDDGSGCAAVLEAAHILRDIPFERTIVFALWDQEEQGKLGSIHYANDMAADDAEIAGVVNMDAIAYDGNGDRKARVHARSVANSMAIADTVFAVLDQYGIDIDLLLTTPGATYSDHASFWSAGYGAVLMIEEFSGDGNPYYHTSNDRVLFFDVPYYEKLAKLSIASMACLAKPFDPTASIAAGTVRSEALYAYPNPTEDRADLWLEVSTAGHFRVEVLNAMGQVVRTWDQGQLNSGKHKFSVDLSQHPAGTYSVVLHRPDGSIAVVRLVRTPISSY